MPPIGENFNNRARFYWRSAWADGGNNDHFGGVTDMIAAPQGRPRLLPVPWGGGPQSGGGALAAAWVSPAFSRDQKLRPRMRSLLLPWLSANEGARFPKLEVLVKEKPHTATRNFLCDDLGVTTAIDFNSGKRVP